MTLPEQLAEEKSLKTLLLTGLNNSVASQSLLGYTTNGTKVVYEGSTKTFNLLQQIRHRIAIIESSLTQQEVSL